MSVNMHVSSLSITYFWTGKNVIVTKGLVSAGICITITTLYNIRNTLSVYRVILLSLETVIKHNIFVFCNCFQWMVAGFLLHVYVH